MFDNPITNIFECIIKDLKDIDFSDISNFKIEPLKNFFNRYI